MRHTKLTLSLCFTCSHPRLSGADSPEEGIQRNHDLQDLHDPAGQDFVVSLLSLQDLKSGLNC